MKSTKYNLDDSRRIEQFIIRLTPREKKLVDEYIKKSGRMRSEWVRSLMLKSIEESQGDFSLV